jgi:hypothetical protein
MRWLPCSPLQSRWCGGRRQTGDALGSAPLCAPWPRAASQTGSAASHASLSSVAAFWRRTILPSTVFRGDTGLPDTGLPDTGTGIPRPGTPYRGIPGYPGISRDIPGYPGIPRGGAAGATPLPFARRVPGAQAPVRRAAACALVVGPTGAVRVTWASNSRSQECRLQCACALCECPADDVRGQNARQIRGRASWSGSEAVREVRRAQPGSQTFEVPAVYSRPSADRSEHRSAGCCSAGVGKARLDTRAGFRGAAACLLWGGGGEVARRVSVRLPLPRLGGHGKAPSSPRRLPGHQLTLCVCLRHTRVRPARVPAPWGATR